MIVSGLVEREGVDDAGLFNKLCEEELGVKPLMQRDGTRRLGKALGVGPRKLLVKLESESAARELVYQSKKLRNSKDTYVSSNIYINPDLTKEEAKQAFERRQLRRRTAASVPEVSQSSTQGNTLATSVRPTSVTFTNSSRKTHTPASSSTHYNVPNSKQDRTSSVSISDPNIAMDTIVNNSLSHVTPMSKLNTATTPSMPNKLNAAAAEFIQSAGLPVASNSIDTSAATIITNLNVHNST